MPAFLEEVDVLAEVHPLVVVAAGLTRSDPVLEVMPDVRAGQVYGEPACIARNAEAARVLSETTSGPRASLRDVGLVRVCLMGSDSRGAPRPRENPSMERAGIGVERGTPE